MVRHGYLHYYYSLVFDAFVWSIVEDAPRVRIRVFLKDNGCRILCVRVCLWKGFCSTGAVAKVTLVTTLLTIPPPTKKKQKTNPIELKWQLYDVTSCQNSCQSTTMSSDGGLPVNWAAFPSLSVEVVIPHDNSAVLH